MIEDLGRSGNTSPGLNKPVENQYENIFNVHKEDGYFVYNILQHVVMPEDIDPRSYDIVSPPPGMPYSILSYRMYGTMNLWWLICTINGIDDPTQLTKAEDRLKIIKQEHIGKILN